MDTAATDPRTEGLLLFFFVFLAETPLSYSDIASLVERGKLVFFFESIQFQYLVL